MGKKATPLSCLGVSALLQIQERQVDVSKELRARGLSQLIKCTTVPVAATTIIPIAAGKESGGKYHVSSKDLRTENNILFDSKLERNAYVFLKGRGLKFEVHPRYVLQESFADASGRKFREIVYEADFILVDEWVIDMKGMRTEKFIIKEKMFVKRYNKSIYCLKSIGELWEFLIEKKII